MVEKLNKKRRLFAALVVVITAGCGGVTGPAAPQGTAGIVGPAGPADAKGPAGVSAPPTRFYGYAMSALANTILVIDTRDNTIVKRGEAP